VIRAAPAWRTTRSPATNDPEDGVTNDIDTMRRVLDETRKVIDGIGPEQLDAPTPCAEWDVRAVLNHITGGADMFATCVETGSISDERLMQLVGGDNLGDDYKGSFDAAAKRAIAAFEQPGAAAKPVTLPFGQMPAGIAMRIAIFDVSVHAVDLARATDQIAVLDQDVLRTALDVGREMIGPEMRAPGVFGPEVTIDGAAPVADRLAAFAGRQV
jgi:uncharacterized protein (TIGR03086 family)